MPRTAATATTWDSARTVADAMITDVKLSEATTTVRELRGLFDDEHVHAAVIVEDGVLLAVEIESTWTATTATTPLLFIWAASSRESSRRMLTSTRRGSSCTPPADDA